MPDPSILLLHSDATALADAMERVVADLVVIPADSLLKARAHLAGSTFDAILSQARLPDGPAVSLLELDIHVPPLLIRADDERQREEAERGGASLAFVAAPRAEVLAAVAAWQTGAGGTVSEPSVQSGDSASEWSLQPIADELARLTHAINNPLAVVVGNAQLVKELFRMAPDDEMIPGSLQDIETAARELVSLVEEVQALRRQIDTQIGE